MSAFGSILKEKRRAAGLSQRQLAERVGVDFSYISKLENDRMQAPASETIARIAECIKCPVEELLAAAKKMPAELDDSVVNEPVAVRFLQEASKMQLTPEEWQRMLGQLHGLREENE